MFVSATDASPLRTTAATPTVAQSCARRTNFWYDQPPPSSFGTRISVTTSCGPSAVSYTPRKNSAAGITRSPSGPRATISASSASSTVGVSEAGSPCAVVPPIVPRCRTCGSPMSPAVYARSPHCASRRSLRSMSEWRVSAPIAIRSPYSRM